MLISRIFFPGTGRKGHFAQVQRTPLCLWRTLQKVQWSLSCNIWSGFWNDGLAAAWRTDGGSDAGARGHSCKERVLQKCCQNGKTLWTFTALSSSQTFCFFFFPQLNSLLAWLFFFSQNSQGTLEVSQYGIIVSWGTVNLWKTPFAFWIYGKRLNLVSLEQHLETQCFDFPNNFLRITGNENSRAQMDFSHRPHAYRDAWFIWAFQQRIMEQANVPTQLSWEGLVLRMFGPLTSLYQSIGHTVALGRLQDPPHLGLCYFYFHCPLLPSGWS